jgi:carotenoid cleavage dioxygenase
MSTVETSKWLTGLYAPLTAEATATDLEVVGTLPAELEGRYLRNGPNPLGPVDPATHHWFTGDGMVHGVRLRGGRAEWYRARWVRSTKVSEALGEEPAPGMRHGGMDGANTNVVGIDGRTFAIVEAGARPVELDDELGTIEHSDFGGTLPNGYTAHPKVDPATGDLHAIAYHWALPHLQYIVIGPDARVRQVEPIDVADGPMVHDCSITERWMVVYDFPVTFDLDGAMSGVSFPYAWKEGRAARIGLLPLGGRGADVRWFEVAPCYSFHPLNAHDDGDRVVLDVVRYPKMFDTHRLGPDDGPPQLWRWTIDTVAGTVDETQLHDLPMEFPRVDERLVGRAHRWGYATEVSNAAGGNDFGGRLVRVDAASGAVEAIDLGAGRVSGEWVMIPRHADSAEDDGWLTTFVYDRATDRSDLVVLSAADPGGDPVATVKLPGRVPMGFHGNWVPDAT